MKFLNDPRPVVLVCRTPGDQLDRHEVWGLRADRDGARFFELIGTTSRPNDFRNSFITRVVINV